MEGYMWRRDSKRMGMISYWKGRDCPIRVHLLYVTKREFKLDAQKHTALKEDVLEELR
jgi:hypothetical protein